MGRSGDFALFAWANGITQMGTQISVVALPLTALLTLDAGAFDLGLLSAVQMLAFLLIGLPAGVWVDRSRRRPIIIWADVVRGVALMSVPVAAWLGVLRLPQLYAVALVARVTARLGTGRTLYGSAALATVLYLPALATGPGWRLLIFPVAASLFGVASAIFGIAQLSYRQRITPGHLLGRVNASMRFLMWGVVPLGGLAGGALGEWLGGYAVFAAGIALLGLSHLAVVAAPAIMRTAAAS